MIVPEQALLCIRVHFLSSVRVTSELGIFSLLFELNLSNYAVPCSCEAIYSHAKGKRYMSLTHTCC